MLDYRPLAVFLVIAVLFGACASAAPAAVLEQESRFDSRVELPTPVTDGEETLEAAVQQRRSGRVFTHSSIPDDVVGQLLWAGQGVSDATGRRTAPSAGGRYPIELYIVTAATVGHYLPDEHEIERRTDDRVLGQLGEFAFDQTWVSDAPLVIVIAAAARRTEAEYGAVAESLIDREAGHVAQNILLQATVLDLTGVPVGGFDPAAVADALALPPDQDVRYLIPLG